MQAYAAQIDRMDRGVGQIVDALKAAGKFDNTLMIFLSDNGASPEALPLVKIDKFRERSDILPRQSRDGKPVRVGNTPDIVPGAEDTYASYGRAWANLSNTPFRFYKRWVHEGGISTPLIVHWPAAKLESGAIVEQPFQLVDLVPTVMEVTEAPYPPKSIAHKVAPLEGRSMLASLRGERARTRSRCSGSTPATPRSGSANGSWCGNIPPHGSSTTSRATAPNLMTSPAATPTW